MHEQSGGCARCTGLMVEHWAIDDNGTAWVRMARCLNCGNLADETIERNRGALVGAREGQRARKGKYSDGGVERRVGR